MNSIYLLVFFEGVLTFISPCLLPMLPIYFLYLGGNIDKDNKQKIVKTKLMINASGFILGFSIVFILLGALASIFGKALGGNDFVRVLSGIIVILFGLNFIGVIKIKALNTEKRLEYNFKHLNFFTSIIFGAVFGFGWSPCIGQFLGSALGLAANRETIIEGMLLLSIYSIGLGIPFFISALIFEQIKSVIKVIQKYSKVINIASGVLLICVGILMVFDKLNLIIPSI